MGGTWLSENRIITGTSRDGSTNIKSCMNNTNVVDVGVVNESRVLFSLNFL